MVLTWYFYRLLGDPTDCTITLQASDLTGDPKMGDFTDDGTPGYGHFPLFPDSPTIDAGNDAVCPETDQLGQPPVEPCDIRAIEFQVSAPADTIPPVITVSASPTTLWPPNGRLMPVTGSGTITNEPGGSGVNASSATYVIFEYGQIRPRGNLMVSAGGGYAFTIAAPGLA